MSSYTTLKTLIRKNLEDPDGLRFSDGLLGSAFRLALTRIDERFPRICAAEVNVTSTSRDLDLPSLGDCLYLVSLTCRSVVGTEYDLEPEAQFTYYMQDGTPSLHFTGIDFPQSGETLVVRYAAPNTIEEFEGAAESTLPPAAEFALVNGTAAHACLLRAASTANSFSARNTESAHLLETSHIWMGLFERSLTGLKVLLDFGFPAGFALDEWDRKPVQP